LTNRWCNEINNIEISLENESDDEEIIECKIYYLDNKLSLIGLWHYLKINREYLSSIDEEHKIIMLSVNITKGFIDGLKNQKKILEDNNYNKIFGLGDF
jgi:hypothetical protein